MRTIADLSVGEQQRVEILKVLFRGARILILDEPTAVLTPQETDQLFRILATLKERGVSDRPDHPQAARDHGGDRSGLRHAPGRRSWPTAPTAETNPEELAELMVGRKVRLQLDKAPPQPGEVLLEAEHLSLVDARGVRLLDDVSLQLRAGEIVGIAGVSGNGQTELLEVLAGIRRRPAARLTVRGRAIDAGHPGDPAEMRALGLAHVPEDRLRQGLVGGFPGVRRPRSSAIRTSRPTAATTCSTAPAVGTHCADLMERFDVRPRAPGAALVELLRRQPAEAGAGARDGARSRACCWSASRRAASISAPSSSSIASWSKSRDAGCAVLVVSVELDEILSLADRILVMFDGRIVGEVAGRPRRRAHARPDDGRGASRRRPGREHAAPAVARAGPRSRCCRWSTSRSPSSPSASSCASSASIRCRR